MRRPRTSPDAVGKPTGLGRRTYVGPTSLDLGDQAGQLFRKLHQNVYTGLDQLIAAPEPPEDADGSQAVLKARVDVVMAVANHDSRHTERFASEAAQRPPKSHSLGFDELVEGGRKHTSEVCRKAKCLKDWDCETSWLRRHQQEVGDLGQLVEHRPHIGINGRQISCELGIVAPVGRETFHGNSGVVAQPDEQRAKGLEHGGPMYSTRSLAAIGPRPTACKPALIAAGMARLESTITPSRSKQARRRFAMEPHQRLQVGGSEGVTGQQTVMNPAPIPAVSSNRALGLPVHGCPTRPHRLTHG